MNNILNKKTLYSFFLCLIISILCLLSEKIAPFGSKTLAVMDADIQYLDFFAYFKDVLEGKANVEYSFAKQLGSTPIAVFSYYLSSPLNLLVYFFSKAQLHIFFSLLVVLKLSFSSFFMAVYLSQRMKSLNTILIIALSLSYGFMQYNLAQASNIMWLDGVYLLPLMLLGIYKAVNGHSLLILMISTAFSMLFNWYIGLINIVFSGFYFLYEYSLIQNKSWKCFITIALKYISSILVALLISSIIFIPTYIEMQNGRGGIDWWLLHPEMVGNILTIFSGFLLGVESRHGSPALESTSLVLVGILSVVAIFWSEKKQNYKYHILFLAFAILILYWQPFIFLFSLFKNVGSYWYRYSHLVGFTLVMIAAVAYNNELNIKKTAKSCLLFFVFVLIIQLITKDKTIQYIYATAFCCMLCIVFYHYREKYIFGIAVLALCMIEIFTNFHYVAKKQDMKHWYSYVADMESYGDSLFDENNFFRVSKLQSRRMTENNTQANYNEGLGFGYNTFSSYTSSPDDRQRRTLHALGYNIMGANMNIINTSILPIDALFSVKFILDASEIGETLNLPKRDTYKHFSVYDNPYYLPLAFNYEFGEGDEFKSNNPFLNINKLYSYLLNRNIELFRKVNSQYRYENNKLIVEFPSATEDLINYAYIDTKKNLDAKLLVDGKLLTGYSAWLSPRIVLIPSTSSADTKLTLEAKSVQEKDISAIEVYTLNLNILKQATDELKLINKVNNIKVSKILNTVSFEVAEGNSGQVFLSIPYDKQWKIMLNGKDIQSKEIFGTLTSISVHKDQKNIIKMSYSVAGLKLGLILTILGVFLVLIYSLNVRRFSLKEN